LKWLYILIIFNLLSLEIGLHIFVRIC